MKRGMALATTLALLPAVNLAQQNPPALPATARCARILHSLGPCMFRWMKPFGWRCNGITRCKRSAP